MVTRERTRHAPWGWTMAAAFVLTLLVGSAWQHDVFGVAVSAFAVLACGIPAAVEWAEHWGLT